MAFIPEEDLSASKGINLAPMIDFLFLMLVFFASLAVSRVTTRDTAIDLVKAQPESEVSIQDDTHYKIINLCVTSDNEYKWSTDMHDYDMITEMDVYNELSRQYEKGILPSDPAHTKVLVRIDKQAAWEPILKLIFAVRDAGFEIYPVYEPDAEEQDPFFAEL
jgi:biopolymer transport protein ExbD